MKAQYKLSDYLHFTRKDRVAIIIIALILLTTFLLPPLLEKYAVPPTTLADTTWMADLRKLEKPGSNDKRPSYNNERKTESDENIARDRAADEYNNAPRNELFAFDPNTLDAAGWRRLGLREKTIATIIKYRDKGGRFQKPEDLRKIYGLPPAFYEQLSPYVNIKQPEPGSGNSFAAAPGKPGTRYANSPAEVDINTADSTAFERLPGIGRILAMRIIRFRDRLGGFYSIDQIKETFGLPDSAFQKIRPYLRKGNGVTRKIDINKAGIEDLKGHPYIRYNIANAIIRYRDEHGLFKSVDDLKKIALMEQDTFTKIFHYLFVAE